MCLPALGLVWEPIFPAFSRLFPRVGNPRGNRSRPNFPHRLEAHPQGGGGRNPTPPFSPGTAFGRRQPSSSSSRCRRPSSSTAAPSSSLLRLPVGCNTPAPSEVSIYSRLSSSVVSTSSSSAPILLPSRTSSPRSTTRLLSPNFFGSGSQN